MNTKMQSFHEKPDRLLTHREWCNGKSMEYVGTKTDRTPKTSDPPYYGNKMHYYNDKRKYDAAGNFLGSDPTYYDAEGQYRSPGHQAYEKPDGSTGYQYYNDVYNKRTLSRNQLDIEIQKVDYLGTRVYRKFRKSTATKICSICCSSRQILRKCYST